MVHLSLNYLSGFVMILLQFLVSVHFQLPFVVPLLLRIYAITRAQQKAIENAQRRGTVIRSSQIPTNNLRINAPSPPQQRIRIGSQGEIIGSPFSNSIVISPRESRTSSTSTQSSSQQSRYYSSNSNGYNTPRQSERPREGSRILSVTPSRQMSRAPSHQFRTSSE